VEPSAGIIVHHRRRVRLRDPEILQGGLGYIRPETVAAAVPCTVAAVVAAVVVERSTAGSKLHTAFAAVDCSLD